MLVAALDTATLTLSCALCEVRGGEVALVTEGTERAPAKPGPQGPRGGHGARLPAALTDLLVAADRKLADVEGYAIGIGPGSFTGLRIGLATWKGLAYASRRPIAGTSSLAAMALAAAPEAGEGALLLPLLDAKKGEVYAGFYRAEGRTVVAVAPEEALAPAALAARVAALAADGARPLAFGGGLDAYRDALAAVPALAGVETPPALAVARLCARALEGAAYDAARLFALEPHYVRASEAELKFPHGHGPGAEAGAKR
ncbi:MAG TPA: tRNA (adenosine(37)-N6)-threonylcarbamoyltransferase complex dimerization subunit type 1 TsaB [Anaeromyxobacteraceae bacterium]